MSTALDNSWIAPWVTKILSQVGEGENPYDVLIPTLHGIFYPATGKGFRVQLWILMGVFAASAVIILAGLLLRLAQGRFWLLHRIDRTILIPNISVHYGLCALVYACLGMILVVSAVRVSLGSAYPHYYVGLQAVWPAVLWTGMYSEIWATFASYYIRRYGAYYRESAWKTVLAGSLPFLLPFAAYVPPFVLFYQAALGFNNAIREYEGVAASVAAFGAAWVPEDGLDIINLLSILGPVEKMALSIIDYSAKARPAYLYVAAALIVTLVVYVIGAYLEVSHLRAQATKLRAQMRNPGVKFPGSPAMGAAGKKVERQLMEEWSSNIVRQASLLEWACTNRLWTAALISLMLLEAAATSMWTGLSPLNIKTNSNQFMTIILVSCYMNGVLSTLVSLLILFRSLDGTSATSQSLQRLAPWLPLPPAVTAEGGTTMATTPTVFFTEQRDTPYEVRDLPYVESSSPVLEGTGGMVTLEMSERAVHYVEDHKPSSSSEGSF